MCPVANFPSSNSLMHYGDSSELCNHGNMCAATQQPWPDSPLFALMLLKYMYSKHTLSVTVPWDGLEEQFIV